MVIVMMVLPPTDCIELLAAVFHVDEICLPILLIVETVDEMVDDYLQGLLSIEEADALNVYHMLYCKFLFFKSIVL